MKSRTQVYQIIEKVCLEKAYANLLLRNITEHVPYTTKMVYGTLQNHLLLRYIVNKYTKTKEKITLLLMCATYELLFMETEKYAVINEFVQISKKLYKGQYTKLVNAVLRKINKEDLNLEHLPEIEKLSITTSHPIWLIKMWQKQYGIEICEAICKANLQDKIQYIRINPMKEVFLNHNIAKNDLGYYYKNGNAANDELYLTGKISIQDYASQEVTRFLQPKPYEDIIDICAAPGSKTLHIAEYTKALSNITAIDLYESRIQLIEQAKQRLGYNNIVTRVADATTYRDNKQYDKVLIDAVCSGYGVLKGKSDIKYHLNNTDMDSIIETQKNILENCAELVKIGGEVVYSTCTLNKKENENQISAFIKKHPHFELIQEKTIFPFECDGFYMAKLRRTQ